MGKAQANIGSGNSALNVGKINLFPMNIGVDIRFIFKCIFSYSGNES